MKKRQLALTLASFITGFVIIFSSCKKINEATELGGGLIPPIDNINTFDTTIDVEVYNDLFAFPGSPDPLKDDSLKSDYTDEQFVGKIDNDPLFGKTEAQMFFELKPLSFPFTFRNKADSLFLDSVVLVLDYVETYGDSLVPQQLNVFEITNEFRVDTAHFVRYDGGILTGPSLTQFQTPVTIIPAGLDDSVQAYLDTVKGQLRIRLRDDFGEKLLNEFDTTTSTGNLNAYSSDSAFKVYFKGFALKSTGTGNAIMGFNLQGENTKLAVYYRYLHGKPDGDKDTTVTYFNFKPSASYAKFGTASHNYIKRDYSGSPLLAAQGGTTPDPFVYIQSAPGSFATIKIPGLAGLNNRLVHRAELIAEQVYDISDSLFPPPTYLYLDAYDPTLSKYLIIPYDLVFDGTGTLNLPSFGIAPINALDGAGKVIRTWKFNLSRYVQHVVNDTEPAYDLRLFAPLLARDQYRPFKGATVSTQSVFVNPTFGKGRIRLAGGTPGPQRMRMRIIYSKL